MSAPLDKLREITARNVAAGGAIYEQSSRQEARMSRKYDIVNGETGHKVATGIESLGEIAALTLYNSVFEYGNLRLVDTTAGKPYLYDVDSDISYIAVERVTS